MALSSTAKKMCAMGTGAALVLCATALGLYWHRNRASNSQLGSTQTPKILANLPADAPVDAYIDVGALRKLQNSPLAAFFGLSGAGPAEDRDYQKFVRDTGFDYSRDLDHVALAIWPADQASKSGDIKDNRMVAIAEGRFNQQKIESYALRSGKILHRGNLSIYEVPGDPAVSFEFISDSKMIFASGSGASDLIVGTTTPSAQPLDLQIPADAPVFAVVRAAGFPETLYSNFHQSPQIERLARSIQKLTLTGEPQGNQIATTLNAECDSAKNALEISILLDGARVIGAAALSDPKTQRQMTREQLAFLNGLLRVAKISHDDRSVLLSFLITPEMLAPPAAHSSH